MKPPIEIQKIPPALVAVELSKIMDNGRRRRLEDEDEDYATFKKRNGTYEEMMKIVQAIEVKVESIEGDGKLEGEFSFELLEYNKDAIYL